MRSGRIPGLFWKSEYRFADYGSKDDFAVWAGLAARSERTTHSIALIPRADHHDRTRLSLQY